MLANNYGTTEMKEGVEVLIEHNQTVGLRQLELVIQNRVVGLLHRPFGVTSQTKKMWGQCLILGGKEFKLKIKFPL